MTNLGVTLFGIYCYDVVNAPILGVDVQLQNLEVNWSHILVMSAIMVRTVNATEGGHRCYAFYNVFVSCFGGFLVE